MADPTEIVAIEKLEFNPALFDPNKEFLQSIAAEVAQITADPSQMTKEDFELINSTKNKLVKARTTIQKRGKELREDAIKYQKDVIGYEKELIEIIAPEEARLKEIEAAAKEYAMTEERKKTLPEFRAKLDTIGDGVEVSDEELLALDPNGRDAYYNGRLSAKLEADKAAADALRAEEDARRAEEDRKRQEEKDAIERDRKAVEERAMNLRIQSLLELGLKFNGEGYAKDDIFFPFLDIKTDTDEQWSARVGKVRVEIERRDKVAAEEAEAKRLADIKSAEEAAKKEAEERAAAERAAEEEAAAKRAAEEKAAEEARAKEAAFQEFLKAHSYNEATDTIITDASGLATLYRAVATYQHPAA
jgi:colicin import membrane protein